MLFNEYIVVALELVCQLVVTTNNENVNTDLEIDTAPPCKLTTEITTAKTTTATTLPDGYTAFPDIGVAYKYYEYALTWDLARKACIAQRSTLAEIDTYEEIQHAMQLKHPTRGLHVGLHRFFNHDEWTSAKTGLHLPMILWGPQSDLEISDRKCARMWSGGSGLHASVCEEVYHFICEIPLPVH